MKEGREDGREVGVGEEGRGREEGREGGGQGEGGGGEQGRGTEEREGAAGGGEEEGGEGVGREGEGGMEGMEEELEVRYTQSYGTGEGSRVGRKGGVDSVRV